MAAVLELHSRRWSLLTCLVACLTISGLPAGAAQPSKAPTVDWPSGIVSVVGSGVFPAGKPAPQARLMARRAATADAYRQLAEAIEGVQVTSNTVVKNFETQDDEIRTSVSALIKGAQILEENVTADGAYEVRVELKLFGPNSLASAVFQSSLLRRKALGDPKEVVGSQPTGEADVTRSGAVLKVSGLIVDARDLRAKAAMMPALFDDKGTELYMGGIQVSNDDLVAQGPVSYVRNLDEAKKNPRVGDAPLVVRAKKYRGPFHADLVLDPNDTSRLLQAGQQSDFLKKMAVVVVL